MDMIKGVRVPERAYRGVLWLVSIVFAAFIVGLGNLVIGDLPLVDQQVMAEPPAPTAEQQRIQQEISAIDVRRAAIDDQLEIERLQLEQAQTASTNGTETFRAWIATRTATTDPAQDSELIARTRALEQLKANERAIETSIAALENERLPMDQRLTALQERAYQIEADALPAQERAMFMQDLRVFLLRLLELQPLDFELVVDRAATDVDGGNFLLDTLLLGGGDGRLGHDLLVDQRQVSDDQVAESDDEGREYDRDEPQDAAIGALRHANTFDHIH